MIPPLLVFRAQSLQTTTFVNDDTHYIKASSTISIPVSFILVSSHLIAFLPQSYPVTNNSNFIPLLQFNYLAVEIFATDSESDDDDNEPFQIHRKLLRRRHVRKEQLRRRRENAAAEKLAEQRRNQRQQQQQENNKRRSFHGTADSTSDVDGSMEICPTNNSTSESTNSKVRKNARGKSTATTTSQKRLWMMIGSNSPLSSPAGTMIPAFSPLRPTKRRKIFVGSSHEL